MASNECKDCLERHPHCHAECEKYKKFREKIDQRNKARDEIRAKEKSVAWAKWNAVRYSGISASKLK